MESSSAPESFRGLLLRHRGRTGLIQRDLAARAGVSRGAVQGWEAGLNYPTAERLQALIEVLLEAGGLTVGQEASEARALWAAAEREAPRMHTRSTPRGSPRCWPSPRLRLRSSVPRIGVRPPTLWASSAAPTSWRCSAAGCWTSAVDW